MLVIRLFRKGKKNQPFFKIVVTDKNNPPRGGRFVEEIGFVDPLTKQKKVNKERAKYWVSKGAQPSDTVHNLLVEEKVIDAKKISVHKKKKKKKGEEEEKKEIKQEVKTETTEKAEIAKEINEQTQEKTEPEEKKEKTAEVPKTEPEEKKEETAEAPKVEEKESVDKTEKQE